MQKDNVPPVNKPKPEERKMSEDELTQDQTNSMSRVSSAKPKVEAFEKFFTVRIR